MMSQSSIICSAPGKIILFGEHVVVSGRTALATSLNDARTYAHVSRIEEELVCVSLPDIGVVKRWECNHLNFSGTIPVKPCLDDDIRNFVKNVGGESKALETLLYLYIICKGNKPHKGLKLEVKSTLKVAVGLGSSAAYNVCLAASFLSFFGVIAPTTSEKDSDTLCLSKDELELVNGWAFQVEKIMHGRPSGVDNSVSTFGGVIRFAKGEVVHIPRIPPLRLLVTNTTVERDAKALISHTTQLQEKYPSIMNPIADGVNAIAFTVLDLFEKFLDGKLDLGTLEGHLGEFIMMNQYILCLYGVGHPRLDKIIDITKKHGLYSKLTGAGGGGCAYTLITSNYTEEKIKELVRALESEGFECFVANIGGPGVLFHKHAKIFAKM